MSISRRKLEVTIRVIEAGGGATALAKKLGVHQTTVSQWKSRQQIPLEWVPMLSDLTGFSYHEMRPNVFPKTEKCA